MLLKNLILHIYFITYDFLGKVIYFGYGIFHSNPSGILKNSHGSGKLWGATQESIISTASTSQTATAEKYAPDENQAEATEEQPADPSQKQQMKEERTKT